MRYSDCLDNLRRERLSPGELALIDAWRHNGFRDPSGDWLDWPGSVRWRHAKRLIRNRRAARREAELEARKPATRDDSPSVDRFFASKCEQMRLF